jgi:hypothetical protein
VGSLRAATCRYARFATRFPAVWLRRRRCLDARCGTVGRHVESVKRLRQAEIAVRRPFKVVGIFGLLPSPRVRSLPLPMRPATG